MILCYCNLAAVVVVVVVIRNLAAVVVVVVVGRCLLNNNIDHQCCKHFKTGEEIMDHIDVALTAMEKDIQLVKKKEEILATVDKWPSTETLVSVAQQDRPPVNTISNDRRAEVLKVCADFTLISQGSSYFKEQNKDDLAKIQAALDKVTGEVLTKAHANAKLECTAVIKKIACHD